MDSLEVHIWIYRMVGHVESDVFIGSDFHQGQKDTCLDGEGIPKGSVWDA